MASTMAAINQQFCLRWNNHQPNFISVFSSLLRTETMCDVTLATEGKHILAHKIVLSACSSYFQMLFSINPCKHPIVILKDVQFKDLKTLIDFVYFGEVNVSQDHLPSLLKTAETLQIKGLTEMPEKNITLNSIPSTSTEQSKVDSPLGSPSAYKRKRMRKTSTESGSGPTNVQDEAEPQEQQQHTSGHLQQHPGHHNMSNISSSIKHENMSQEQRQPTPQMDDRSPRSTPMSSTEAGPSSAKSSGWVEPHVINIYSNIDSSYADSEQYAEFQEAPLTVRKKRYNSCSSQDRERFNEALEAVRYGGIGFCKAARLYGVNNRSLWLEYKKRGYPTLRPGPKLKAKDPQLQTASQQALNTSTTTSQRSQTVQTTGPVRTIEREIVHVPREAMAVHRDVQQRLMAVSAQGAVTSVQQVTSVADYNNQQLTTTQPTTTFFQSSHLTPPFTHYYHNPPL